MKRRTIAWLTAAVLVVTPVAGGSLGAASAIGQARTVVMDKSCSAGYVKGHVDGSAKCLRAGEYCDRDSNDDYHRYGFDCHGKPARLHHR